MFSSNLIISHNESVPELGENHVFETGLKEKSTDYKVNEFDFDFAEKLKIEHR